MVATNPAAADELAAPLDLLLTSSAVGIAERVMPNVSWSRFALNLARQPRTVDIPGSLPRSRIRNHCRGSFRGCAGQG